MPTNICQRRFANAVWTACYYVQLSADNHASLARRPVSTIHIRVYRSSVCWKVDYMFDAWAYYLHLGYAKTLLPYYVVNKYDCIKRVLRA